MELEYFSPAGMEETIRQIVDKIDKNERGSFNAMLAPRLQAVSWEDKSCTLLYRTVDWMSNPIGIAHGGVLCAIADLSMGTLSKYYAKDVAITPTVSINLNYLRPVPLEGEVLVVSAIDHAGRRLNQLHCTIYNTAEPDKPCITATGTYFVEAAK